MRFSRFRLLVVLAVTLVGAVACSTAGVGSPSAAGRMSAVAARSLAALGYTDIVELKGGMEAWEASGRPVSQTQPGG